MANFAVCQKDPLIDLIRRQLGCNPVLKPSTRNKPLDLLVVKDGKTENIGYVQGYLENEFAFPTNALNRDQLIAVSGKDTNKVNLDFGLQLLSRLTGGIPSKEDVWKTHFSGQEQIAFQFDNVEMISAPLDLLREELRQNKVKADDPMFQQKNWLGNPAYQFFIISGVITSKKFSVKIFNNGGFSLSPQLKTDLADANLTIGNNDAVTLLLEHTSPVPLTFAFACHRIYINEHGALMPLIETGKVPPLSFGQNDTPNGGPVLLSDNAALLDVENTRM